MVCMKGVILQGGVNQVNRLDHFLGCRLSIGGSLSMREALIIFNKGCQFVKAYDHFDRLKDADQSAQTIINVSFPCMCIICFAAWGSLTLRNS